MAATAKDLPPDDSHRRPDGATDNEVAAAGKLSEAFEWIERARGRLFDFHQMIGRADLLADEAADMLEAAGHPELAQAIRVDVVGRNVLDGRWTFQIVEEFDGGYYASVKGADERVRNELMGGRRHVFEAELKEQRRTKGHPDHQSRPKAG